jgi:hypothetical protein
MIFMKYFKGKSEYASSYEEGLTYTEFDGEHAIRQVNVLKDKMLASSSLQDWDEEMGFLLYDGKLSELDLSKSTEISKKEFEAIWQEANNKQNEKYPAEVDQ